MARKIQQKLSKELSGKQLAAIAILSMIPPEYKNIQEVAERVGVERTTIHNWKRDDENFKMALAEAQHKEFNLLGGMVRAAHIKKILKSGDASAIRLFYERAEEWYSGKEEKIEDIRIKRLAVDKGLNPIDFRPMQTEVPVDKSAKEHAEPKKA